jgi:hypothetical protein
MAGSHIKTPGGHQLGGIKTPGSHYIGSREFLMNIYEIFN